MSMTFTQPLKSRPGACAEETDAQVLRALEAARAAAFHVPHGVVIAQYPDTRSLFQRLQAWWYLRARRRAAEIADRRPEPDWPRHWRTTKYI